MAAALVEICVDPRLNHELIKVQVAQRLQRTGLKADIYLLSGIGGNPGQEIENTLDLLTRAGEPTVLCAVLHHDECLAAKLGLRMELTAAAERIAAELAKRRIQCPVLTGNIRTEHTHLLWSDDRPYQYVPFSFGVGMGT